MVSAAGSSGADAGAFNIGGTSVGRLSAGRLASVVVVGCEVDVLLVVSFGAELESLSLDPWQPPAASAVQIKTSVRFIASFPFFLSGERGSRLALELWPQKGKRRAAE